MLNKSTIKQLNNCNYQIYRQILQIIYWLNEKCEFPLYLIVFNFDYVMILFRFVGINKIEMEGMISNLLYPVEKVRFTNFKPTDISDIYTIGIAFIR